MTDSETPDRARLDEQHLPKYDDEVDSLAESTGQHAIEALRTLD